MDIQELKDYFSSITLPNTPIYLNPSAKINDVRHFLDSHFKALETNPESRINEPILARLLALRELLLQAADK